MTSRFIVLTPRLDGRDGISEVSRQVVRALAEESSAGVEAWTLDGGCPDDMGKPGVTVRSAAGNRARLLRWTIEAAIRRSFAGTTVVAMHVHLAPLGALLRARGARLAAFLHGIEVWRPLRLRERSALELADRVVANSRHTVEQFRAVNPWWGSRSITVAALGASPAAANVTPSAERGFVLIVGRLSSAERYKGHDALIDAWPAVLQAVPDARLIVAGDGDDRPRLEARVAAADLTTAIRFTGRVSDDALRGLYQACALFAMPSTGEGFGLVYVEAMREAKPCLALRAAADIIEDGVTGVLLDEARPAALAAAIAGLLNDGDRRARLGRAAGARAAAEFTEQQFARRFRAAMGLGAAGAAPPPASRIVDVQA